MTSGKPINRRVAERRTNGSGSGEGLPGPGHDNCNGLPSGQSRLQHGAQRRKCDRRVSERRQRNIGPPPETGERRFSPDIRGTVFPLYYNFN